MTLLVAMMNKSYDEFHLHMGTAWRVDSLRVALWVMQIVPTRFQSYLINFGEKSQESNNISGWLIQVDPDGIFLDKNNDASLEPDSR